MKKSTSNNDVKCKLYLIARLLSAIVTVIPAAALPLHRPDKAE